MLRIGLRRDLGAASAEVSTEPDLDGRLTCGLHFARQHMSDTNPDKLSDLANLGLDPACARPHGRSLSRLKTPLQALPLVGGG